jgi:hypothetical protein
MPAPAGCRHHAAAKRPVPPSTSEHSRAATRVQGYQHASPGREANALANTAERAALANCTTPELLAHLVVDVRGPCTLKSRRYQLTPGNDARFQVSETSNAAILRWRPMPAAVDAVAVSQSTTIVPVRQDVLTTFEVLPIHGP